jgi:phospholipid N-methyltransferase
MEYSGKELEMMSFARNYYRWMMSYFAPFTGEHVIEIGAGCGNVTDMLIRHGAKHIIAMEPSDNMYTILEDKFRHSSSVTTVKAFLSSGKLRAEDKADSIIYINVLEHIENDFEELLLARDFLSDGGRLLIFVPALPFLYGTFDSAVGHFRRYTKHGLLRLVRRAGYDVLQCRYFDMPGAAAWWMLFRLLRRKAFTSNNIAFYDTYVVPIIRRLEKHIEPPLGKNLLLIAQKQ